VRKLVRLVLLVYVVTLLAPAAVVTVFLVQRDRIIKESCVERFKPVEQNCCKGSCHVRKQLKEQEGPQETPGSPSRIELRVEPAVVAAIGSGHLHIPSAAVCFGPAQDGSVLAGHAPVTEPVPWC